MRVPKRTRTYIGDTGVEGGAQVMDSCQFPPQSHANAKEPKTC